MATNRFLQGLALSLVLCMQLPAAVLAQEEASSLQLAGSVEKQHEAEGNGGALKAEIPKTDESANPQTLRAAALKKLTANQKLTAEDFRDLGIGVLGYESDRTYFTKEARVSALYRGGPAAEAGIRIGDHIIVNDSEAEDAQVTDPTVPSWMFSCGLVGAKVDITVKRGKDLTTYHLVRMNMEDIPEDKVRHAYERMVQETGLRDGSVQIEKPKYSLKDLVGL